MKYLINRCVELMDQYECCVDRQIICITNDLSVWEQLIEIEIFQIAPDGELELIKDCNSGEYYLDIVNCVIYRYKDNRTKPLPQDIINILKHAKKWEY